MGSFVWQNVGLTISLVLLCSAGYVDDVAFFLSGPCKKLVKHKNSLMCEKKIPVLSWLFMLFDKFDLYLVFLW